MQPASFPLLADAPPSTPMEPSCPICQGRLLTQRGLMRCVRCGFTLCIGCEGADPSEFAPSEG